MRFKGRLELEHGIKQLDIAPFMSVVFLLLIFMVFSSGFITQSGLRIGLPKVMTSELIGISGIEIVVDSDGIIYINGKSASMHDLRVIFRQPENKNKTVLIKSDKHVSIGVVAEIWDLARSSGISFVNIATSQ